MRRRGDEVPRDTERQRRSRSTVGRIVATAAALALFAAVAVVFAATRPTASPTAHRDVHTGASRVAPPPVSVVGTLIPDDARGVPFDSRSLDQGADCDMGSCWSYVVIHGYLYPVRGRWDAPVWRVAGPALAGPGIDPRNPYLSAVPRSWDSAIIWVTRQAFASTSDGGRRWYLVSSLPHHVGVGAGGPTIDITVAVPTRDGCDYYYDYVSRSGVTWRRGPPLPAFITTVITTVLGSNPPPSCTQRGRRRT